MPRNSPAKIRYFQGGQEIRRPIGEIIRLSRKGAGMTQAEVAHVANVSPQLVSAIEVGRVWSQQGGILLKTLAILAVFDVEVRYA